jgi:hypothetical protein
MSSEHIFEDKGKAKPKPTQEKVEPHKENSPPTVDRASGMLNPAQVAQMQQVVGNTAVQRFLAQRSGSGPTEIDEGTSQAINQNRGGGQALDDGIASKAGQTMGQDFSNVNVHTDSQANQLSEQLGAKAFTTGNDIFFREGAYSPSSSDGQHPIAHELTHVVQQGASAPSVQGKMSVNDPNDQFEAEADHVADTVMAQPEEMVQQQEEDELVQEQEDDELVQQQEEDELVQEQEDDELVQQEEMPEEEMAAE